jgi:large subunit ribosomal protein L5
MMPLSSYVLNLQKDSTESIKKSLSSSNDMELPVLKKVVLNIGIKATENDKKRVDYIKNELSLISGQLPILIKSTKSISSFKLREGVVIGCAVTLRRRAMFNFLDKMILVALPRIRDFRGLNCGSFNKDGHYSFGIKDSTIFLESGFNESFRPFGMNINIITSAKTKQEAMLLLKKINLPLK